MTRSPWPLYKYSNCLVGLMALVPTDEAFAACLCLVRRVARVADLPSAAVIKPAGLPLDRSVAKMRNLATPFGV